MELMFKLLNYFGISVNVDSDPFLLFCCVILILSLLIVVSLFNVLIYFLIIYVLDDLKILDKYYDRLPVFVPFLVKLYKNTRKILIIYELCAFGLAIILSCTIIWFSVRLVYAMV